MSSPSDRIADFLCARMEALTTQFLLGLGDPVIFECTYLTYLEVLYVSQEKDSIVLWERHRQTRAQGKTTLWESVETREDLVQALQTLWVKEESETLVDLLFGEGSWLRVFCGWTKDKSGASGQIEAEHVLTSCFGIVHNGEMFLLGLQPAVPPIFQCIAV